MMKRSAFYTYFLEQLLSAYSKNEASIITKWVWESMAGISDAALLNNENAAISEPDVMILKDALHQLLLHKPVQYVTGESWFYKMKLKVNEQVLIPRPETEELVELVIKEIESGKIKNPSILDIGTGSGCIAIALKKQLPSSSITAIDSSEAALQIAMENATLHATEIKFMPLDFLDEMQWKRLPEFDVIVSNPPYIPIDEMNKLAATVTAFEPHAALFVPKESPLLFYEKIASFKKEHLTPGGKIFMETHEAYAKETAALFIDTVATTGIIHDISGKERMIKVCY